MRSSREHAERGITYFHFDRQADSAVAAEQLGEAAPPRQCLVDERRGISALEDVSLERPMTMLERAEPGRTQGSSPPRYAMRSTP